MQKRGKAQLLKELNAGDAGAKSALDRKDVTVALELMLATAELATAATTHPVSSEVDEFLANHGVKACALVFHSVNRC